MANYLAVFNFKAPTGKVLNIVNYSIDNPVADVFQLATNHIMNSWKNSVAEQFVPSLTFESITWREDAVGSVPTTYNEPTSPFTGTSTNSDLVSMQALLIRKHNDNLERPTLGRMYIGGVHGSALDGNGDWDAAVAEDIRLWVDTIREFSTVSTPANLQMQIKAGNPTAPNTQAYQTVDRVTVEINPASQTRRRRGVGV